MPTVLRYARPVARKAHQCDLCLGVIQPGEQYDRQTNIFDGRVYDWLTCRGPVGCDKVAAAIWADHDWEPIDELNDDSAYEWARDKVRTTGSPLAAAYLTRREIAYQRYLASRTEATR